MIIDFRSDTLTKPTQAMKEAMFSAEVGDDVFGEDPSIKALEQKAADMFGMQAALFCPSGTMTNQIAIRMHTQPQGEVICDKRSHIYLYEGGGVAYNSLCSVRLLDGKEGKLTASMVEESINNPHDVHLPLTQLVSLENTVNKAGGSVYRSEEIEPISKLCKQKSLKLHLDGARLFNALVATNESPRAYGKLFDSISICLSKGLGAPVGSLLLGTNDDIVRAKRIRKVLGGGMRQAGFLAAAATYALDHHVERLVEDHKNAALLADTLSNCAKVKEVLPTPTNIVIFELKEDFKVSDILDVLKSNGLLAIAFGKNHIRLVTHLDLSNQHISEAQKILITVLN